MLTWRQIWSFFDAALLQFFDRADAALLREIAQKLPDETRDVGGSAR